LSVIAGVQVIAARDKRAQSSRCVQADTRWICWPVVDPDYEETISAEDDGEHTPPHNNLLTRFNTLFNQSNQCAVDDN
jgi:hypothetical protein